MDIEYQDPDKPTNFSNPMYESLGDVGRGKPITENGKDIIVESPTSVASPPDATTPTAPPGGSKPNQPGGATDGHVVFSNGFNPTSVETEVDTHALVEAD